MVGCRSSLDTQDGLSATRQDSDAAAAFEQTYRSLLHTNEYALADAGLSEALPASELFPLLIAEERVAIADRDMGKLAALWVANGTIIDQRATKKTEDDYIWQGRTAILDRYELAVFRYSPPLIQPPTDLTYTCDSEALQDDMVTGCWDDEPMEGEVVHVRRENGDVWQFIFVENRWWFLQLQYNP